MAGPLTMLSFLLAAAVSGAWGTAKESSTDACAGSSDDDPLCMASEKRLLQKTVGTHAADMEKSMHGESNQLQKWSVRKIPDCMMKKWAVHRDQMNILVKLQGKTQKTAIEAMEEAKAFKSDLDDIYDDVATNEIMDGALYEVLKEKISKWETSGGPYAKILKGLNGKKSDAFDKEGKLWEPFVSDLELLSSHQFLHGCTGRRPGPPTKAKSAPATPTAEPPVPEPAPETPVPEPATTAAPPVPEPAPETPVPEPATEPPVPEPTLAPVPEPTPAPTSPNQWSQCFSTSGCKLKPGQKEYTRRRQKWHDECIIHNCIEKGLEWNQDSWAECEGNQWYTYYNDKRYKGFCARRTAPDFWTQCYENNACKTQLPGADKGGAYYSRRRENYRDNCIQHECKEKGLEWKSWKYQDCGNWKVKGYCGLPTE